jgi:ADP-ribose pyrophosphatase YjhB (NUDIX family)
MTATAFAHKPHIVLGVSVSVWRGGEVLLVRRGRDPGRGLWAPVGGRVEFGETTRAAAVREVREETGVTCALAGLSDIRDLVFRGADGGIAGHVALAVFAARWVAGEAAAGDDADAVAWVAADRLADGTAGLDLVEGVVPYILATRTLAGP